MPVFLRESVLVPIDYAEWSAQAVRTARSIARSDADVTVLYVAQDFDLTLHPLTWTGGPLPSFREERLLQGMDAWVKENNLGDVNLAVKVGDPGKAICDVAKSANTKLVVMPSHGRHGFARIMLGSVAERVIRHCHCSVLVIHPDRETDNPSAKLEWLPRRKVLVPVDFSESTISAIRAALEIAQGSNDVEIISVVPPLDFVDLAETGIISADDRIRSCLTYMARFLTDHGFGSLPTHACVGDPGTKIAERAAEIHADLIIMPTHGRHGIDRWVLGSTTERVLRYSKAPVLVLRSDATETTG